MKKTLDARERSARWIGVMVEQVGRVERDERALRMRLYAYKAGLTRRTVAVAMGLSEQTVSQWFSGGASPTLDHLQDFCDLVGVTVVVFLGPSRGPMPKGFEEEEAAAKVRKVRRKRRAREKAAKVAKAAIELAKRAKEEADRKNRAKRKRRKPPVARRAKAKLAELPAEPAAAASIDPEANATASSVGESPDSLQEEETLASSAAS